MDVNNIFDNILNLSMSNKEIIELIKKNKPFSVIRLGVGHETHITVEYINTKNIDLEKYLHESCNLNGIYSKTNDKLKFVLYCNFYNKSIKEADILASHLSNSRNIGNIQNFFSQKYNLKQIHSRSLEPFYICMENEIPWTHYLLGKKILIINPFVESFKKQMENGFKIFKDDKKKIFLDGQEILYYKSYQTIAGNHIHNDWFETYKIMCNDIKNIDFDIALLGCGGYGLPLCHYIKSRLNKSAIYIGGGLQLLFGVMGNRWENNKMWKQIIKDNDCKFIRPSKEETCLNHNKIEGACYW